MTLDLPDFTKGMGGIDKDGNPLQFFHEPPVWFHDPIDAGILKWTHATGTVTLDSTPATAAGECKIYSGSASMKMLSPVALTVLATRTIAPPPIINRVGFEVTFITDDITLFSATPGTTRLFSITFTTTAGRHNAYLAYVPSTGVWYISDDTAATWTAVLTHKITADAWCRVKLVLDFTARKYVTLYVNYDTVDLSAYDIDFQAAVSTTRMLIGIRATGSLGNQATLWIDEFKVTYNEP